MSFEVEVFADFNGFVVELSAGSLKNTQYCVHNFGADAVAFSYGDSWFC